MEDMRGIMYIVCIILALWTYALYSENKKQKQNFEIQRLEKGEIKRALSIYFDASVQGETIPDIDGIQFFNETKGSEVDR